MTVKRRGGVFLCFQSEGPTDHEVEAPKERNNKAKEKASYKRKWNIGTKFDESDVDERLPQQHVRWRSFPTGERPGGVFSPREQSTPIGNVKDMSKMSFMQVT